MPEVGSRGKQWITGVFGGVVEGTGCVVKEGTRLYLKYSHWGQHVSVDQTIDVEPGPANALPGCHPIPP